MAKNAKNAEEVTGEIVKADNFSLIENKMAIGMDDVVSVFTSRYEERLYADKELFTQKVQAKRKEITDKRKAIVDALDVSKFTVSHPLMKFERENRSMNGNRISVNFEFSVDGQRGNVSLSKTFDVKKSDIKALDKLRDELTALGDALNKTLTDIRDIGRKERQVRARIIEKKLENSGMEDVLRDSELRKMIGM